MSKLETINKSISEIRNILGEECVDIEQLPNLIRNIVNDSSRSGFTTTFLFSNDLNPTLPVGGTFNIETGLVEELEGNWSSTIDVKTKSISSPIWMSSSIFDPSGKQVTNWSVPVNLKGPIGESGIQGPPGKNGTSIIWKGEFSSHPSNPLNGWTYRNTYDKKVYTYQDGYWYLMTIDGKDGTSISIAGLLSNPSELPVPPLKDTDCYIIDQNIWIWNGNNWYDAGQFKGDNGVSIIWKGSYTIHPDNPEAGWAYYNTIDKKSYIYDGTEWDVMTYDGIDGTPVIWKGEFSTPPTNPQLNWCYRDTDNGIVYIYNGYIWEIMVLDGKNGTDGINGADGVNGKDGISITWLGEHSSHPLNPQNGLCYRNTNDKKSYIYQDGSWYQMTIDGADGKDGKDGTSIQIAGSKSSPSELPTPPTNISDCYIIDQNIWIWDGDSWYNAGQFKGDNGISIIWKGSHASHIINPQSGWAYYNTSEKRSYIYDGTEWDVMTYDGIDGDPGNDGLSIVWKGDLKEAPANPQLNWCYRDTDNKKVYIYNGIAWELMVTDGSDGKNGADGKDGLSVFITYHDNPINQKPNNPTGDGTLNGWHTNGTENANWMSQKVANSYDDGEWGDPIQICGLSGSNGSSGPVIYPEGKWESGKTYIGTSKKAPYVIYNNECYIAFGTVSTEPIWDNVVDIDDIDWANPTNKWIKMEEFTAIYTDIVFADFAKLGSWVFSGDYMFSQNGTNGNYESFDSDNWNTSNYNGFIPNIVMNAKTGSVSMCGKNVNFNADGTGNIGRILYWTENGIISNKYTIELNYDSPENYNDNIASWTFESNAKLDDKVTLILKGQSDTYDKWKLDIYSSYQEFTGDFVHHELTVINTMNNDVTVCWESYSSNNEIILCPGRMISFKCIFINDDLYYFLENNN